jgi:hypothetical protein
VERIFRRSPLPDVCGTGEVLMCQLQSKNSRFQAFQNPLLPNHEA